MCTVVLKGYCSGTFGYCFFDYFAKILEKLFSINKNKGTVGVCWVYVENHLKKISKIQPSPRNPRPARIPALSGVSRVFRQFRLASNGSVLLFTSYYLIVAAMLAKGNPPWNPFHSSTHIRIYYFDLHNHEHLFLFEYSPIAISDGI